MKQNITKYKPFIVNNIRTKDKPAKAPFPLRKMFLEQAVIFVLTYMHVACIIVAQKSSQNNDKLLYWNGLP